MKYIDTLNINLKKSYDCVYKDSLLNILRQLKLPQRLINLIKGSILFTEIQTKVGNITSQGTLKLRLD